MSRPGVLPEPCRPTDDAHTRPASKSQLLKWVLMAASALSIGAEFACNEQSRSQPEPSGSTSERPLAQAKATSSIEQANADRDCCMGLNECKGKGGCAVPESHACRGQNECRGKGGCNAHCPR